MLKRIIRWFVSAILVIFAIYVAIGNRHDVELYLDPFRSTDSLYAVPLYIIILASIWIGLFLGGIVGWYGGGKSRKAVRKYRRQEKKSAKAIALKPDS